MPSWTKIAGAIQPADPYFEWGGETLFVDLFAGRAQLPPEQRWFPVIVELAEGVNVHDFALRNWHHPMEKSPDIEIPAMYANLGAWARRSRYCTAMMRKSLLDELRTSESLRKIIHRVEIGRPLKADHKPVAWQEPRHKKSARDIVVTGVIDDGLAFAHELFREKPKKTRIEYFWNQDGLPPNPPAGFFDGWELRKDGGGPVKGIDDYLKDCTYVGSVDEDQLYARSRHVDFRRSIPKPVARRGAHGTHVMHLAAGYPLKKAPKDQPIICVQLPVATTADTSGASLAKYALDGLHYIISRADTLAHKPPPVIVNLSYGMIAGPHNGSSVLEQAIDELIELRSKHSPLRVVLPAGNSNLARCHAQFELVGGEKATRAEKERTLSWRVQPDDRTPSFMEIWLPEAKPEKNRPVCELLVTTPTGDTTPAPIQEGEEWVWQENGEILCKVFYLTTAAPGRSRNMIFIALAPTATLDPVRKVAPSGTWKILLRKKNSDEALIDAWIQRDDTPYGYPRRGRQSRFDDDEKNYQYWDQFGREVWRDSPASYIQRKGTINAIATGGKSIVIGGFRRKDRRFANYSAGGPVVTPPGRGLPHDRGPDAMAVSDDSFAHPGVLAAGTRTGSTIAMGGTSVAAPQIARWIVENGGTGDRTAVAAMAGAPPPPAPSPDPLLPDYGGGGYKELAPLVDRKLEKP